jgi:uncharacterized damage-inducible protein DinB
MGAGATLSRMHAPEDGSTPARWTASTVYEDMWLDPDDDPRDTGNELTDERTTLLEYLTAYRLTFEMKCEDLSAEQLARRSVPPSTMSLLGLLRHLAEVDRYWFREVVAGEEVVARDVGHEDAFEGAVADDGVVEAAWRDWRTEVAAAEAIVAAIDDLGALGRPHDGRSIRVREVLVHVLEEYARHCGHADLLRECIDGRVGQ